MESKEFKQQMKKVRARKKTCRTTHTDTPNALLTLTLSTPFSSRRIPISRKPWNRLPKLLRTLALPA